MKKNNSIALLKASNCTTFNSTESSMLGGLSNTPLTNSLNVRYNACIDYLKIRFNRSFYPSDLYFKKLLTLLRVDSQKFDKDKRVANFENTYVFDANVLICTGGFYTRIATGEQITILELKGQACREFEARGGNWIDLFEEIKNLNGMCKRIDVAFDDFTNCITKEALVDKIRKKLYVADWKKDPDIIYSNNDGFSITFGRHAQKELCIYNKVAERKDRGYDVSRSDWMRYEARFKSDVVDEAMNGVGDLAFNEVYVALMEDKLDVCSKKLIYGLLDIKQKNNEDRHNLSRVETWDKWKELLNVDDRFKCHLQYKVEASILRKVNWYTRSALRNRILLEALNPQKYKSVDGYFVYNFLNKLKNRDVASINYMYGELGLAPITRDELVDYFENNYRPYSDGDNYISYLIGKDNNYITDESVLKKERDIFVGSICKLNKCSVKVLYICGDDEENKILVKHCDSTEVEYVSKDDLTLI